MKHIPFSLRTASRCVAALAVFLSLSTAIAAQVTLSVQVGFEGKVTPGRYAPVSIEVRGLDSAIAAQLHVTQPVGNEWRGETTVSQELGLAVQADGVYTTVIPIYDPVNPIAFELISATGVMLTSTRIDLKNQLRPEPYPILDKKIPRFDDRAAVIDARELPEQWWALDAADSLWIASSLSTESWETIEQWVFSGGSLVVITGTDFYRMDSPIFRDLLPLGDPTLSVSALGTSYVTGTPRDASIEMTSDEGFPLLIEAAYGAGHVSLVTVQAQNLSPETIDAIAHQIEPATRFDLSELAESLLDDQVVATLHPLVALGMVGFLALAVIVLSFVGRRRRGLTWILSGALMGALAVLSGFASNPDTHVIDLYTSNIAFASHTSSGSLSVFSSSYSRKTDQYRQAHASEMIPVIHLPRSITGSDRQPAFCSTTATELVVASGKTRHWHSLTHRSATMHLERLNRTTVRISNYAPETFEAGWILVDGTAYPLDGLPAGTHDILLSEDQAIRLSLLLTSQTLRDQQSPVRFLEALKMSFPLQNGIWLVAIADEDQISSGPTTQKVRTISIALVRGEEDHAF